MVYCWGHVRDRSVVLCIDEISEIKRAFAPTNVHVVAPTDFNSIFKHFLSHDTNVAALVFKPEHKMYLPTYANLCTKFNTLVIMSSIDKYDGTSTGAADIEIYAGEAQFYNYNKDKGLLNQIYKKSFVYSVG